MHRALQIEELLRRIFQEINDYDYKRDCVVLATICKRWLEPALDLVWRDMDNLRPLFALLCPMAEVDGLWVFEGSPVLLSHWNRFFYYAKRIRTLKFGRRYGIFHRSVWTEISQWRPRVNLFPGVKCIQVTGVHPADVCPFALLVLNPGVRTFELLWMPLFALHVPDMTHLSTTIFHLIHQRSIRLTKLSLISPDVSSLPTAVRNLSDLTSLNLEDISLSTEIWRSFASIPHLTKLNIKWAVWHGGDIGHYEFHELAEFAFDGDLNAWTQITGHPGGYPSVHSFTGKLRTCFEDAWQENPVQAILRLAAQTFPKAVELVLRAWDLALDLHPERLPPATFGIAHCPNLQVLQLSYREADMLTRADIVRLLKAAPNLSALQIKACAFECRPGRRVEAGSLSLDVLDDFIIHCPNIQSIALHFSAEEPLVNQDIETPRLRQLRVLDVLGSDVQHVQEAALYLACRLPPDARIKGHWRSCLVPEHEEPPWVRRWGELHRLTELLFAHAGDLIRE